MEKNEEIEEKDKLENIGLIEKVKERIAKDNQKNKIREQNLNKYKKYDMMDFEKTKFEIIQKSVKKFSKITDENVKELLTDVENMNFSKVLDEVIKAIIESKFEFKDVNAMILIISDLNQIYEGFGQKFMESLKKAISDYSDMLAKTHSKNEDDEEKRQQRKKALYRLYIESYIYGIFNDFNMIKELLQNMLKKEQKDQFYNEFPILVNLLKVFAESLFNFKPKAVSKLIDKGDIEPYELKITLKKEIADKYLEGFNGFYSKRVLTFLDEEHKTLIELEKKNFENMRKLDSNNEINQAYQKQRTFYLKYIGLINEFADILDFDIPELANEKTFRFEEQKKNEIKLERINKYDPFSDESEYLSYTSLISIKNEIKIDEDEGTTEEKNKKKEKFDSLLSKLHKLDSKEGTDELTNEFLNMYNVKNRKQLVKSTLRSSKSNYAILKYFARFIANISQVSKEASSECVQFLMEDYNDLNRQDKLNMFDERIKNIRFISEMVKFELFPMQNIFEILKRLIDDFKDYSIDVVCNLMESCGRFLYLNELSHIKFKSCLDTMKQMAHHRLSHDERSFNSIINSIQICRPQESTLRKAVKVRTVEEEYLRFLLYHLLNKESIKKIAALIRRMDWSTMEHIIFKVFFKFLNRANEIQIRNACTVLSLLKEYHPSLIHNLINIILEEIRIGLDKNDFNDSQHRILMCMLISQFYIFKLISSELIFYVLYMILTYNPEWNFYRRELIADNQLDSPYDTSRIQMVVTVLDVCGPFLKKEKLDEFIHFLQIYILSKQYLALDVENKVTNCLENLYPNFHVYNDFAEALKDSKKFKGFNFDIDDIESIHDQKNQYKVDENEFKRNATEDDFKRKKEKEAPTMMNIDDEINKIITESLVKAKGKKSNDTINPLNDIKKKDFNKLKENKIRLITKHSNKITVKELDKDIFK